MNEDALHFAQPLWLVAGGVLVVLGLLGFMRADRRRRADLQRIAHARFHDRLVAGWSPALRWTRRALWLAAILAIFMASARPQFGYEWREVKRRGIDILFAVDTSRSMLAEDLTPNRLERARLGILDFLGQLEGDRVGLVPFAGTAFALCPLTLDYDAFRESLNSVNTDLLPQQGTDLASAIREAERLFDAEDNNHRLLVLITDGEDLEGEALSAAKEASVNGTTIYTVGVGAADGQTIPVRDRFGRLDVLRDEQGEVVKTRLDADTLEKIASDTGGLYVPLGRGAEGLDAIYQERLALVPKSELAQKREKVPLERFQWPLGTALVLLLLQAVLGERKSEGRRPPLASAARRIKPLGMGVLLLLAATRLSASEAVASYNEGTRAFGEGEFESAAERLRSALDTDDLSLQERAYYNLGNSLYRMGQAGRDDPEKTIGLWEESVKAFEDALALDPNDSDAAYNRDFVKRKLEELRQQQNQDNPQDSKDQENDPNNQDQQKDQDQNGDEGRENDPSEKESQEEEGEQGQQDDQENGEPKDEDAGGQGSEENEEGDPQEQKGDKDPKAEDESERGQAKGQEERQDEEQQGAENREEAGEARQAEKEAGSGEDSVAASPRKPGEMSRDEALRLLESLANDERVVVPAPLSEENRERRSGRAGTRKTW